MLPPGVYRWVHEFADDTETRMIAELRRALDAELESVEEWLDGVVAVLRPALQELHLTGQAIGMAEALDLVDRTVLRKQEGDDTFFTDLVVGRDAFISWLRRKGVNVGEQVLKAFRQRRELASNYVAGRLSAALEGSLSNEARAVISAYTQQDPLPDTPALQELANAEEGGGGGGGGRLVARAMRQMMRGLTDQQRKALERQMDERAEEIVRERLRDEDGERIRAALQGEVDRIVRDAGLRADDMRRWRAERIVRTESMRALNRGMEDAWMQLAEDGQIDGRRAVKEWQITYDERTCRVCRPLDGKQRRLGSMFGPLRGGFGFVQGPPVHPNCRCTLDLKFADVGQVRKGR